MKIAVVIPVYNAAAFVERTLDSVLAQSVLPDEVIIVDDASSDDTVAVIERKLTTTALNWRVIRSETNSSGPGAPMNIGIAAATSEWIVSLDHDDELVLDRIDRLRSVLPNPCGVIIGRLIVRPESQDRGHLLDAAWANVMSLVGRTEEALRRDPTEPAKTSDLAKPRSDLQDVEAKPAYEALAGFGCYAMSCSAMAFPKSTWSDVGGFDDTVTTCIDFAFLEAVLRTKPLGVIDAPVAYWTWSPDNLSHQVHKRVFDVSTVMERIEIPNANREVRAKLRATMLERTYLLTCRGEYRKAAACWWSTQRRYGLRMRSIITAGKCCVRACW